jgi:hypothetical protein
MLLAEFVVSDGIFVTVRAFQGKLVLYDIVFNITRLKGSRLVASYCTRTDE